MFCAFGTVPSQSDSCVSMARAGWVAPIAASAGNPTLSGGAANGFGSGVAAPGTTYRAKFAGSAGSRIHFPIWRNFR